MQSGDREHSTAVDTAALKVFGVKRTPSCLTPHTHALLSQRVPGVPWPPGPLIWPTGATQRAAQSPCCLCSVLAAALPEWDSCADSQWLESVKWAVSPRPGVEQEKGRVPGRSALLCGMHVSLTSKLRGTSNPIMHRKR